MTSFSPGQAMSPFTTLIFMDDFKGLQDFCEMHGQSLDLALGVFHENQLKIQRNGTEPFGKQEV